jgi:hypothetical protein
MDVATKPSVDELRKGCAALIIQAASDIDHEGRVLISPEKAADILVALAQEAVRQVRVSERRRALRLIRRTLAPHGCKPTKDAADLMNAIDGGAL